MSYDSNLVALSLLNFKAVFTIEGKEYVSVLEFKRKYVPDVSKSMWKSRLSRAKVNCIRADTEQTEKLKTKFGTLRGGYFLVPFKAALMAWHVTDATLTGLCSSVNISNSSREVLLQQINSLGNFATSSADDRKLVEFSLDTSKASCEVSVAEGHMVQHSQGPSDNQVQLVQISDHSNSLPLKSNGNATIENKNIDMEISSPNDSQLMNSNANDNSRVSSETLSVNASLLKKLDSYGQLENDPNCDDDMQKKETYYLHALPLKNNKTADRDMETINLEISLPDESKLVDSNTNGEIRVSSDPLSINASLWGKKKLDSCTQLGNNPDCGHEMQKDTLHSNQTVQKPTGRARHTLRNEELSQTLHHEISQLWKFWTCELNAKRSTPAISESTANKMDERLRQYLYFLYHHKKLDNLCSLHICTDANLWTDYLEYLSNERKLSKGTQALMIQSILYVCKWLGSNSGEICYTASISGLRNLQSQLQRSYEHIRRMQKTSQHRKLKLHWSEVLDCIRRLKYEFETFSGCSKVEKARLCRDLMILLLFSSVSPNRNLDFILIRILDSRKTKSTVLQDPDYNYLVLEENGDIHLDEWVYKTVKTYGWSTVNISNIVYLSTSLTQYIDKYRPNLIGSHDHDYLFLTNDGRPFLASDQFTVHVNGVFERFCGVKHIGFSQLRHSVITYFLTEMKVNEDMRQSLSRLMKHSSRTQRRTYNMEDFNEEKKEAIKVLSETTAQMIGEDTEILHSDDDHQLLPFVNQIVACVDRNSTLKKPIIYLGMVVRVKTSTRSVILAELESLHYMKDHQYILKPGSTFEESFESLVYPVDCIYKETIKCYELRTSKRDIHQYIFE